MDIAQPAPPPYGSLLEVARKGAGLSIQRAADAAGISKATWIDTVRGYRKRNGAWEHIEPKSETIARMAHAVGVSPERLTEEAGRPDAAEILTEIGRGASSVPRPSAPVSAPPPVSSPDSPDAMDELRPEAEWDDAWRLYPHPDDRAKRDIIRLTHLTLHQRAILVEDLDHGRAHPEKDKTVSREETGLPCRDPLVSGCEMITQPIACKPGVTRRASSVTDISSCAPTPFVQDREFKGRNTRRHPRKGLRGQGGGYSHARTARRRGRREPTQAGHRAYHGGNRPHQGIRGRDRAGRCARRDNPALPQAERGGAGSRRP